MRQTLLSTFKRDRRMVLTQTFIVLLLIFLFLSQSYAVINTGLSSPLGNKAHSSLQTTSQSETCSDAYSQDVDSDKIVDSLEREIEENPSSNRRVLIQYRRVQILQAESSFSSHDNGFAYELSREFPVVKVEFAFTLIDAVVVTAPSEIIPEIAKLPNVVRIESDAQVQATLDTAVPVIGADRVWADYGYYGQNQTIAILDTGIWADHPDFQGKIVGWKDFVNVETDPYDDNGHGTMVASVAAGTGDGSSGTYKGVAYMANIVAVKVLDARGRGYVSWIILGLEWIVANKNVYNVTVVNLSLGSQGPSDGRDVLSLTCNQVVDEGIVVVVAAGNFGPQPYTVGPPAAAEKVMAVGAVDRSRNIASWSSRGPTLDDRFKPDVSAVGVSVMAASLPYLQYPDLVWKIYRTASGTSVAAPMIAGAVALLRQAHPDWTPDMVKAALLTRAVQRGGGVNNDYGYGVADVFEALKGPKPTLSVYTWKFVNGAPTFAEASTYGQRSPNPYVLINGTWFTPSSPVEIRWDNTTVLAADVPVNENESLALNATLPRSSWGNHYISAWNATGFVTQNKYEILRPTLEFSSSELFQTTTDIARPGVTIWAKGRYYDPNGEVTIKWDNTTLLAEDASTDSEGIFKTNITILLDATTGLHFVSAWNGTEFTIQRELHILVATPVSGVINENTTWTRYGSPYVLTGNVIIYENKSLTIEPGVEVTANGMYYIWIYKGATLNATGTESSPIIFTANRSITSMWGGIRLHYSSQNTVIFLKNVHISYLRYAFMAYPEPWQALDFSGMRLVISNCKITHSGAAAYIFGVWTLGKFYVEVESTLIDSSDHGIWVEYFNGGTIRIINNTFTSGIGDAITIMNNGYFYEISGNTIMSNYGSGISLSSTTCYGIITNNLIMYNSEAGLKLYLANNDHLVALNNHIARNRWGVLYTQLAQSLRSDIVYNDMHSNVEYDMVSAQATEGVILNATHNYWGVISREAVEDRIYHFYDDFTLREIIYRPFLNASTRAYVCGYLSDQMTGLAIENATITATGTSHIYTSSNASGYFKLEGLLPGEYSITITKEGYETISWFESVGEAQAFETEIRMKFNMIYATTTLVFEAAWEDSSWQVAVTSNSTITNFNFNQSQKQVSFNVAGQTGTTGFCNVTIPNELLGGPYIISVNDLPVTPDPTWIWNATHSLLYFTYDHSTHMVKIIGTTVVPEFPSAMVMPLFMIVTLLAAIVYKRKGFKSVFQGTTYSSPLRPAKT